MSTRFAPLRHNEKYKNRRDSEGIRCKQINKNLEIMKNFFRLNHAYFYMVLALVMACEKPRHCKCDLPENIFVYSSEQTSYKTGLKKVTYTLNIGYFPKGSKSFEYWKSPFWSGEKFGLNDDPEFGGYISEIDSCELKNSFLKNLNK